MRNQDLPIKKLIVFTLLVLGVVCFFYFDLVRYFTFSSIKESKDSLATFSETYPVGAVILYIGIYILQTTLSLPGATILTLIGGFLFGSLMGALYVNIGATTGAVFAFLSARYLFRDLIERKWGSRLLPIQAGFLKNDFNYLMMLRLMPIFPFFLVNLASGLTRIPLSTYIGATALGIIPGSFIYSHAGSQLGTINSLHDIVSPSILFSFFLLGLLALVPVIYQKFKEEKLK
ncbi:MAG: TVP38/TMEM64 family protein [Nitrospirota bacterium]